MCPWLFFLSFFFYFILFLQHVSLLQDTHPSSRAAAADPPILIDGVPSIVTSTPFAMVTPRMEAGRPPLLGVFFSLSLSLSHTHTHIIHHRWTIKHIDESKYEELL